MSILDAIEHKRDRLPNTRGELEAVCRPEAPDYQLAAWLMASFLNGLDTRETADLTRAMAESGERLDLGRLPKPWVDKHSTGGVGDKTTLVVLPLLAACGLTMVKMSGRGLGITGGTIDKLESIPGFQTDLSPDRLVEQASRIGIALAGQTARLAPADGRLYALRGVTGTVASIPLITASILSKKLAGGAETVVIDVKCGSGAFMSTVADARALAASLQTVGSQAGLQVVTEITDMDQPLGRMVGNALEVKEALATLRPGAPATRFRQLCIGLASATLATVGRAGSDLAVRCLEDGSAFQKAHEWLTAQGASPLVFDSDSWEVAPATCVVSNQAGSGWVCDVSARAVGEVAVVLGAGRRTKADVVDPRVGIECLVEVGDRVDSGQPLFIVHAASPESAESAAHALGSAVVVGSAAPPPRPIFIDS